MSLFSKIIRQPRLKVLYEALHAGYTTHKGRLGLGLFVAKRIVEKHGEIYPFKSSLEKVVRQTRL